MKQTVWFLTLMGVLVGCAHKKAVVGSNRVSRAGVLSMFTPWVKDKKTKYDLHLTVTNESGKGILIYANEVHCFRGPTEGTLKNFGDSNVVDFAPGEKREYNIHCDFDSPHAHGNFRVQIANVYGSPVGGGAAKGLVLARDIVLEIPEGQVR